MEYLEDVFPEPALRPASPQGRAKMRLWTKWPDEGGHIAYSSLAFAVASLPGARYDARMDRCSTRPETRRVAPQRQKGAIELGVDDPALAVTMRKIDRAVRDMQATLAEREWLAGDVFTLADIALIPYVVRLDLMTLLEYGVPIARGSSTGSQRCAYAAATRRPTRFWIARRHIA